MNINKDYYLPEDERPVSSQYKNLLREIIGNGHSKKTVQLVDALTVLGPTPMRFNLREGIPLFTERNLALKPKNQPLLWQQSIAEIIAFINGAHTLSQIESYGCLWWGRWATAEKCSRFGLPEGNMGPGFYGKAFTQFPSGDGKNFNQIAEVIEQIKSLPETRTHMVSPWIAPYTFWKNRRCTITPCHGTMYFEVYGGKISLVMTQRSADLPIGIPFNTFQYAVLLLMVAQATNLFPYEFVHQIMDAHIYVNQLPAIEEMMMREDRKFPIIKVNPEKRNLFDFRMEDFTLEEYNPHPAIGNIPVNDV